MSSIACKLISKSAPGCRAWSKMHRLAPRTTVFSDLNRLPTIRGFAALSMDMLKQLRAASGAPIVECKKALQSTDNDLDAAMDWLREHGAAKASSKVQGRETTEGLVAVKIASDKKSASVVKVASETDFASRSAQFATLAMNVVDATLSVAGGAGKIDEASVLHAKSQSKTVKDLLDEAIVAIRENISVAEAIKVESSEADGILVGYVHNKMEGSEAGSAAAVVEVAPIKGDISTEILESAGKKLAMHIVAARPQYMAPEDVPHDEVEKEKAILTKQLGDTGKPPEIVEKIVVGRLRKFYEGICVTEQPHMIEEKNPTVGKVLKELGIKVNNFTLLSIA